VADEREDLAATDLGGELRRRPRRLRRTGAMREMVRETQLRPQQFIYPVFATSGSNVQEEIVALPGQHRLSRDRLIEQARRGLDLGVPAVLIFGHAESKDDTGSDAANPHGVTQEAVRALKREVPDLVVMTDVCLCAYTAHGHCGLVDDRGQILNDPTLEVLARVAVSHAEAGADVVAPSDMMDGRVGAMRGALDASGYEDTAIMSYAAKYASAFYGPFREAVDSSPQFGDRRSYQMDPGNRREALREAKLDVEEGADIVMVKPALAYLDVIAEVRRAIDLPVAAYNVSGEYAMVAAAAERGWVEPRALVLEVLTSIARAGADMIITYHALEAAAWLQT
jgi:porphobilinogen synthase